MPAARFPSNALAPVSESPSTPASGDALDVQPSGWSSAAARGDVAVPPSGATVSRVVDGPTGVREGEVVDGKYRIGKHIGSGAMGTVFAAQHLLLDQKVAIKFLVPEALGHSEAVARFVREARAAVMIKSEHVVRVLDVCLLESGAPYIVMEYLQGCDLAAWLQARGRLRVETAVDFILQACDAIAEAHDFGVIHRDVKPANLFAVQRLGVTESIKVLDFGISKAAGRVSSTASPDEWRQGVAITQESVPIGSPCYMSPEQMESARDVDRRTDIWALGITLCELVTGRVPFEGQSLVQVYSTIKSGARLRLRDRFPDLPRGLETVILKCLETEPKHRYRNVRDFTAALVASTSSRQPTRIARVGRVSERGASESPSRATPSPRVAGVPGPDRTLVSQEHVALPRGPKPNAKMVWAAAFAALVIAVTVIRVVSKRPSRDGSAALVSRPPPPSPLPGARAATMDRSLSPSSAEPALSAGATAIANEANAKSIRRPSSEPSSVNTGSATGPRARVAAAASFSGAARDAPANSAAGAPSHDERPLASPSVDVRSAPSSRQDWSPPDVPK
jgi:serine/threonine protein kinase